MSKAPEAELPRSVDPYRLAERQTILEGEIPLEKLSRFSEAVSGFGEAAVCQVKLSFSQDSERRRIVTGELEAPVLLECQRCMTDMPSVVESRFVLGLVTSDEQASQLPKELEPFLTDEFSADLWQMAEDELLLALPPFPLHDRDECPATPELEALEADADESEGSVGEAGETGKDNPFSVLAGLQVKKKH